MPVSVQETVFHHVGNGVSVTFAYTCQILQQSDLQVFLNDEQVTSGFVVAGVGILTGGTVSFDSPPASLTQVRLERVIALERQTDYQQNGDLLARVLNPDFNRIWMGLQQHRTMMRRALLVPRSDPTGPGPLPTIAARANKLLSFDENGDPIAIVPIAQSATALQLTLAAPGGASGIGITPAAGITATDVQGALTELSTEIQQASVALLAPGGSEGIGHIDVPADAVATTVQARMREIGASLPTATLPNIGTVDNRNCTILGDSISHGAYAINTYLHGWARIFARCFNAENRTSSYGFVNFLSMGFDATLTTDVHVVNFYGAAWVGVDSSVNAGAQNYPAGMAMRPTDATSGISIDVPSFQNRAHIFYGKRPGSANFTISINGGAPINVVTDGDAGWDFHEVAIQDNGYGSCNITLQSTNGAVQPDIIGMGYLSGVVEPIVNNFSNSGRRLRYVGEALIVKLMQESSTMIVALGHNDQGAADDNDTEDNDLYYAAFMQRITWLVTYAKQYGVKLVVPDFCWGAPKSSRTRLALRKLAADANGIYIDLPGELFRNREQITPDAARYAYLIDDLKMWTDGSHPYKPGQQWIAESIAKRMGLSCSSKADALAFHDWWMPLVLKPATGVTNYFTAPNQVSSFKRNGAQLVVRAFLRQSPAAAFPAGTYRLQDAWNPKAELTAYQGFCGPAVLRSDTGATVSSIFVTASGALDLKVTDGTWINYQDFTFTMPTP